MPEIKIRAEKSDDYDAILKLTYDAFLTLDYSDRQRIDEHFLIKLLRGSKSVIQDLCFVAEVDGEIAGHILYTKSKIIHDDNTETETITFGPLSVAQKYQRQGVGSALVFHSIEAAKELGFGAVLIVGVPDYYPKLGFKRAAKFGLTLEDETAPDAFMAYEILPGYLNKSGKLKFLATEFELCEEVGEEYTQFHEQFMKKYFPNQLKLRPFWGCDIALMERWLYTPHIAKWYEHPEDWLNELKNRNGEFSFISHFIAEFEGKPIGFGQYYDCFLARQYEAWSEEQKVGEKQGDIFSIDYLIGEVEYLQKGFGKEIVRFLTERVEKLGAGRIIVQPDEENEASQRTLTANGYRHSDGCFVKEF